MLVYLIRHGHAVSDKEDPTRPLSLRGIEDMERIARFLAASGVFAPRQLWHSPLRRARETAEVLLRETKIDAAMLETTDLQPEDDPEETARRLNNVSGVGELAIVGHEPHLSALATLLVRGKTRPVGFEMKKGAVLALENTGDFHKKTQEPRWIARWHIYPGLLAGAPDNDEI